MKAARIAGPQRFEIVDTPVPQVPDGHVLVKMERLAVCGSDLRSFDRVFPEEQYPLATGFPCHECAGVVEESRCDEYSAGQRVIVLPSTGAGLVEYLSEPPSRFVPLPGGLDLSTLLMCQHMGTVMYSCQRIGSVMGRRVVVLGQGPIGLNFTYWMARMGARQIIVTDLFDYRLEMARGLGATATVNASREDVAEAVAEATEGALADVVIEAAGEPETVNQIPGVLRFQGLAVLFGQPHMEDVFPVNYDALMARLPTIVATIGGRTVDPTAHIRDCVELVRQGRLELSHLVTHRIPFDEVQSGFDLCSRRSDNVLKVVMEV